MKIEVINTGSELLTGQVVNTNIAHLGERLITLGLKVFRQTTVPDGIDIKEVLAESIHRSDVIIVTGGLGPTQDDLTKEMLAELLDLKLHKDDEILEQIKIRIESNGTKMRDINIKQALIPEGGLALANKNGTAPGIYLKNSFSDKENHIFLLPGPPKELLPIYDHSVEPILVSLVKNFTNELPLCLNHFFSGMGESELASQVDEITSSITHNIEFGYCLKPGGIILRCIGNPHEVKTVSNKIISQLDKYYLGEGCDSLPLNIISLLKKNNNTLSVAESCTGGYLSSLLTNVSGSSEVFKVGFVTYSNEFKNKLLNVNEVLFEEYGAVSTDVAIAMAEGCLKSSGADFALSITGIAGPSGGSAEKPVGTVYIAISTKSGETQCIKKIYQTNRILFKEKVAMTALNLLRDYLFI